MNKTELVTTLRDVQEYYLTALKYQVEGNETAATARIVDADETLQPLIDAASEGRLAFKGSIEPIEGQTIGERIRFLRERDKTSQIELLRVIGKPKSHQAWLSRVEDGEKKIPVEDLKRIAIFFGVSIDQLVP